MVLSLHLSQATQTVLQQIQHKSRLDSPTMRNHHYTPSNSPAYIRPSPSSHQAQSHHPSYSSNAFADMVGSFSVPQHTHQMRSPWYTSPPAPQRYAPSSRRAAASTFTARSPPSPSNSSYTTTSSNTSSFASQPGHSSSIAATHRPLASWTHGSNIWRKRLIGMSNVNAPAACLEMSHRAQTYTFSLVMHALSSTMSQSLTNNPQTTAKTTVFLNHYTTPSQTSAVGLPHFNQPKSII